MWPKLELVGTILSYCPVSLSHSIHITHETAQDGKKIHFHKRQSTLLSSVSLKARKMACCQKQISVL
eukprot:UN32729